MVVVTREGRLEARDIINLIRGANPNIVVSRVSGGDTEHTVELTAQGETIERLDADVNNLITMLRNVHQGIEIERVYTREISPIDMERLDEGISEGRRTDVDNKRSAREIR